MVGGGTAVGTDVDDGTIVGCAGAVAPAAVGTICAGIGSGVHEDGSVLAGSTVGMNGAGVTVGMTYTVGSGSDDPPQARVTAANARPATSAFRMPYPLD